MTTDSQNNEGVREIFRIVTAHEQPEGGEFIVRRGAFMVSRFGSTCRRVSRCPAW